jgi:hypothetical protein
MAAFARQYDKYDKQKPHRRIKKAQPYASYGKTFVYLRVVRQCKKPTRKWLFWFFPTHEPTLKKPKEPFFANARTDNKT